VSQGASARSTATLPRHADFWSAGALAGGRGEAVLG